MARGGRERALGTTLDTIRKRFGEGAVMKLGGASHLDVEAISTGCLSLDIALGIGGVPRGRITEIYGPEGSGKTTLCLHVKGREISVGVVGNDQDARMLPPLEIVYRKGDVTLTFEKKELDNDSFLCPAPLNQRRMDALQLFVLRAYRILGLRDYARFDTIWTDQGPMFLEANSFAGLMCTPPSKPHSYIGFMARAEGKGGKELLDEIVQAAVKRLGQKAQE